MTQQIKPAVIAIVGPTCTGKTDLSIALAKMLNGEIIALDSRTIYKKMDIGTAKPSLEQQKSIKHYALDLIEPSRFLTVSDYIQIANQVIEDIISRGKVPILCGGTGLYARALLEGIQIPAVAPQIELRNELNNIAEQKGNEELYSRLLKLDPICAAKLNINDRRRIIRALEVSITSGKPMSELATQGQSNYETTWIGLNWADRAGHKAIISTRLNKHLEEGLIAEVETLWSNSSYREVLKNSINYKEFIPYLDKEKSLEEACQQCIQSNFQLARKQMIWFRARPFINWLSIDQLSAQDCLDNSLKMLPANFLN